MAIDQPTTPPTITDLPPAPNSATDTPSEFDSKANTFVAGQVGLPPEQNASNAWTKETADITYNNALESQASAAASAASAAESEQSANDSQASANYVGLWSDLTGSLSIGVSVGHEGGIWRLNVNLADVTTSEPSLTNADWQLGMIRATDLQVEQGTQYTMPDSLQLNNFVKREWSSLTTAKTYNDTCWFNGKEYFIRNPVDDPSFSPPDRAGRSYYNYGSSDSIDVAIDLVAGQQIKAGYISPSSFISKDIITGILSLSLDGTYNVAGGFDVYIDGVLISGSTKYSIDGLVHEASITMAASFSITGVSLLSSLEILSSADERLSYYPLARDVNEYNSGVLTVDPEFTWPENFTLGAGWSISNNALIGVAGSQSSVTTQLQGRTLSKVTILANLNINSGSITIGDETFTDTGFTYQVITQTNNTLTITKSSDFDGSIDYLGCKNSEVKQVTDLFGSFSGSSQWTGIASADNGLLYCAPYNSTQVLEIDPVNKTTNLFGSLAGGSKWLGIASADNGLLYCAPYNSTQVLEIDPVNKTTNLFGSLTGSLKWTGIASADNGMLYCAPYNSTQVLEIDPVNKTTNLFGSLTGSLKWTGIASADNGMLYCSPYDSTQVLEIDPVNKTTDLFGILTGPSKWQGIASADNGLLYCAPYSSTQVLEIDPVNKTTNLFGSLAGGSKWRGMASADNGLLYCAPYNSTQVLEIDPVNKTTSLFSSLNGAANWIGIASADNGMLYCSPYNSTQVLEIGSADGTLNGSPSINLDRYWQQSDGNQQIKKTAGTIKLNDTKLVLDSSNTYTIQSLASASYGDEIVVIKSGDNEPTLVLDSADIAGGKLIQYGFQTDTELTLDTNDTYTLFFNGVNLQVRRG